MNSDPGEDGIYTRTATSLIDKLVQIMHRLKRGERQGGEKGEVTVQGKE